ncbi:MAG TPA: YceI family protein [Opitutaceae bacterium]
MLAAVLLGYASLALASAAGASPMTFTADPDHSSIKFAIRHFFTDQTGRFTRFDVTMKIDRDDWRNNSATASIEVASVATDDSTRDAQLLQPEFFDSEKHPFITFKSTSWKQTASGFDVAGDLTIKGIARPVVLKVKALGFGPGMFPGSTISGWEASTTVNRFDFGVSGYPKMLGADVKISIDIEADLKN